MPLDLRSWWCVTYGSESNCRYKGSCNTTSAAYVLVFWHVPQLPLSRENQVAAQLSTLHPIPCKQLSEPMGIAHP
jgi:hypothetical protein